MKHEVDSVLLFIAELSGNFKAGSGTMEDKIKVGQNAYVQSYQHELDLNCEHDRSELHENIWLQRLYKDLDGYFGLNFSDNLSRVITFALGDYRDEDNPYQWQVPIEVDATSSMMQIMGVLLNDKRMLNATNVIGDTLEDAWYVKGLPRLHTKKFFTPVLYGSSKQCYELWQDNHLDYTAEHVAICTKELSNGMFGLANMFKEFLINNANMKANMEFHVWDEKFTVECNRFRYVGEQTKAYKAYDSINKTMSTVLHTETKKVPDLEQFRRYTVTGLVHALDSQLANYVAKKTYEKYGWVIPIHDAFLCSPAAAKDIRKWYGEKLEAMHKDRKNILNNFFKSVGVTSAAAQQWEKIKAKVVPLEDEFKASFMALK